MFHAPLPAADRTVKVQPVTDLFNGVGLDDAPVVCQQIGLAGEPRHLGARRMR